MGSPSVRFLYHASYGPYLASILRWGLGGAPSMPRPNWEDSAPGTVYLAESAEVAISYAESADVVPADWLDHIVVLEVRVDRLDPVLLVRDPNVRNSGPAQTFCYQGVVPVDALVLVQP